MNAMASQAQSKKRWTTPADASHLGGRADIVPERVAEIRKQMQDADFASASTELKRNIAALAREVFVFLDSAPLDGFGVYYDEEDGVAEFVTRGNRIEIRTYYDTKIERYQVKRYQDGEVIATEWQRRPYDIETHFRPLQRPMK